MSSVTIGVITCSCLGGGVLFASVIRRWLPQHHLREDSRDVVKLGTGLIATLTALVLGFLTSSAKSTLDAVNDGITRGGAEVLLLDGLLSQYGPETTDARQMLRRATGSMIAARWPEQRVGLDGSEPVDVLSSLISVHNSVLRLSPSNDTQRSLQSEAAQLTIDLRQLRWQLIGRSEVGLPIPFLVVLVFWLTVLFAGFGVLAPPNATNMTVLLLCALSVTGAVFLLEEMSHPMEGIMKVSSAPLVKAFGLLGK